MDSISRLKLRGSRLEDVELGLLGLIAGYGSIWLEGVGGKFGGTCSSDLGRVMDGWRQRRVILFTPSSDSNSAP